MNIIKENSFIRNNIAYIVGGTIIILSIGAFLIYSASEGKKAIEKEQNTPEEKVKTFFHQKDANVSVIRKPYKINNEYMMLININGATCNVLSDVEGNVKHVINCDQPIVSKHMMEIRERLKKSGHPLPPLPSEIKEQQEQELKAKIHKDIEEKEKALQH